MEQPQQPKQQQQEVNMEEAWAAFRAGVTSVFKQVRSVFERCLRVDGVI